jgi:prepilin-type N-terminal cleavage/methylation domain-containing protein
VSVNKQSAKIRKTRVSRGEERGFSMIELLIVVLVLMIVSGMAIIQLSPTLQQQQANAAMIEIASELRQARELAMTERRNIQVSFPANNQITLTRMNLPLGQSVLTTLPIQAPATFMLTAGTPDTPDGFGNAGAIEFGNVVNGPPTMLFQSDGTFVDTSGNLLNGTVFIGIPNVPTAARAVTIVGATGRIRMYKANPTGWIN